MYLRFKEKNEKHIHALDQLLKQFNPIEQTWIDKFTDWCKQTQESIGEEQKRIRIIQMSSISPELCSRTGFNLAIPGTYRAGTPPNRIKYFVGQFSVYMSKQQPKDVVVRGYDGNFYQYLLKGHEDLRLDERIMQFFRLINSLVRKEDCFNGNVIGTVCVIPLSPFHGLVQWIPGTETLRNVVEQYRRLHRRDPMEEYVMTADYGTLNFDFLQPIQKMQIIESIFQIVPDSDIADFFWLRAETAESWLKQTNTFAISTGMTSIVGYIIGLGDRHPSNMLIDQLSGSVIHIDFGDCFEKAAKRQLMPEVVPFRLTRMMIRAMGASGVDGLFMHSLRNMSQLLRDNHRVLVMVLAIFVQEPLVDPEEAEGVSGASGIFAWASPIKLERMAENTGVSSSSYEMTKRVREKLAGRDFGGDTQLTVADQATKLVHLATDTYNLSRMYSD
jgi:phosphatidylinositol kinase/protein kinase (PI-3  family)